MLAVAAMIVFYVAFPRYELRVTDALMYRWDRWTGHVEAVSSRTLRGAPWATSLVPREQTTVTVRPAIGDDVTDLMTPPPTR